MQMPELVTNGHLYLAVPPLFKVSAGNKVLYADTEKERDLIISNKFPGDKKVEVSRFKGLGEMNPSQLKQTTMNPETRKLIRVVAKENNLSIINSLVMDLMGKNPEPRFKYITSNAEFVDTSTI